MASLWLLYQALVGLCRRGGGRGRLLCCDSMCSSKTTTPRMRCTLKSYTGHAGSIFQAKKRRGVHALHFYGEDRLRLLGSLLRLKERERYLDSWVLPSLMMCVIPAPARATPPSSAPPIPHPCPPCPHFSLLEASSHSCFLPLQ